MQQTITTTNEEQTVSTQCRQKCEVYSRVSGYLRPVNSWNKGKQEEFSDRKTYTLST